MIIRVGNIKLRVEIGGTKSLQLEREVRKAFSGYLSRSATRDASLKIFVLPEIHLDRILLDEEKEALKRMLEKMEKRYPYAKFPYEWMTGVHRNGSNTAPRPKTLPRPFITGSQTARFSLVPLRHCLLAMDHVDHQAVALVRGQDITVLNSALILGVQAAFCLLAPGKRAVMLHGASAEIGGGGYLFLGVSGSGKSTLAKGFPDEDVFSDESTLCFMREGTPFVAPTPFTQTPQNIKCPEPAPLKRLLLLKKTRNDFLEEISPGTAMARILHNHIHFFSLFRNQEALEAFQMVESMVRYAPAYVLHFTRSLDPLHFFEDVANEEKKAL